jgi:ABC-2 type transport system permease protein
MWRIFRLYLRLLGTHLRATLEYQADFWVMALGAAMTQVTAFVFIAVVFTRVPTLNGWSFWSVVLLFAMIGLSEGFVDLFFSGMWFLAPTVHRGDLDYLLVRPYPVILQILSAHIGLNGLGNVVTGGTLLVLGLARAGIAWSLGTAVLAVILLACALITRAAIMFTANAVSLFLQGPGVMVAVATHQVGELARYPLSVYPGVLKVVLAVAVPFAFVSIFPISTITGNGAAWVGLFTPLVAAYCVAMALLIFRRGVARYESTGS